MLDFFKNINFTEFFSFYLVLFSFLVERHCESENWGGKACKFQFWEIQIDSFDLWMGLPFMKSYLLRCWDCLYFLIWIAALFLSQVLKLPLRKLES